MYVEESYQVTDLKVILDVIREYPLATVITAQDTLIEANHIPLYADRSMEGILVLQGHIARNNPLWTMLPVPIDGLAVIQGPNSYISPSWYPSKQETGKVVPTWNYVVIHLYGALRAIHDPYWILSHLERITQQQETGIEHPWRVDDAPRAFIDKKVQAVVGIEMEVRCWIAKFKISQNQSTDNKLGVVHGLEHRNGPHDLAMARWVKSII